MLINFPITTTVDGKDVQLISPIIINDNLYLEGNALGAKRKTLRTFTDTDFNITTQLCNETIQEKLFPFNVTGHIFLTNNNSVNGYAPQLLGQLKGSVFSDIKYYDTSTSYETTFSFNNKPFTDDFAQIALKAGSGSYPNYGTIVSMGSPTFALMTPYITFEPQPPLVLEQSIQSISYGVFVVIPIFPTSIIENGKFKINEEFAPPQIVIRNINTYNVGGITSPSGGLNDVLMLGPQYTSDFRYNKTWNTYLNNMDLPQPPSSSNPYAPGGTSGTGGGGGDFDTSSDPVDFPNLPVLSAARCGLITMFNPSISELQQLSTKMWSKDFLDNLTRLISDPIDIIVALTIVPVSPPVSGREEVIAGLLSTGVEMNVISNQYMSFSCGTYKVTNFYDAALDYSPYTKASIYLPYIGVRQLNVDEIMGAELTIQYNIDLFTGACVAMIKVNNAVMYSFDGNVATQIPVSAANYSSLYSSLIQGVASIATTAVTGGATAPMLAAQAASFAVNAVTSSKPNIQRAGGITGANGLMGIQTPFLIFEIPRQSLPENQQVYTGYPSNITYKLSDLSGFTQISEIHLDGIPATSQELEEIERLLKEGVII